MTERPWLSDFTWHLRGTALCATLLVPGEEPMLVEVYTCGRFGLPVLAFRGGWVAYRLWLKPSVVYHSASRNRFRSPDNARLAILRWARRRMGGRDE